MIRQIILLFLIVCHSSLLFSQNDSASVSDAEGNTNRIRVLIGYSHFVEEDREPKYGNVFLNGNYRVNNFDSTTKLMSVKWQFEGGLNLVKLTKDRSDGIGIVPYLKTGPSSKVSNSLSLGGNVGLVLSLIGYFGVAPFFGANAYYTFPFEKRLVIEIEAGGHSSFFFEKAHSLIYIAVGIGFK